MDGDFVSVFEYIPSELHNAIPKTDSHYFNCSAYRWISGQTICKDDFIPRIFEANTKKRIDKFDRCMKKIKVAEYAISLFMSYETAESKLNAIPTLDKSITHYAVGDTSIDFGIATIPANNGHISWYLYDYENCSPFETFKLVSRRTQ